MASYGSASQMPDGTGAGTGIGVSPYQRPQSGYFPPIAPDEHTTPLANSNAIVHAQNQQLSNNHLAADNPLAAAVATSPNGRYAEDWDANQRGGGGGSVVDGSGSTMHRTMSYASNAGPDELRVPSRNNTLRKKASLRRSSSLGRSGSRRSMKAGSVRSLALQSSSDPDEAHSAFYCPVPTSGNPTDVLANRFQTWRKHLKDIISYFREIQTHYEQRSKSLQKMANAANNIASPPGFLVSGGIADALQILRHYNKSSIMEAVKAREIEEDVILALTGLRSDLQQKIKEIKNLSGDFKNTVEKEMDATRRAVKTLQDVLGQSEVDSSVATGKQDPYLLRLAVDRQVERQIDEENYLHQAYLNLESSGRELEAIVVGEIQKAYNAFAGILKREADIGYTAIEELRAGPISMPKDTEWSSFVQRDDQFVDPDIPIRSADQIHYPGREHVASQEIRAGLLERKSKYLKSYTAGWYVLSATHLHEFKSADKAQAPVMSLFLPEQKLGSHSTEGGSSNKFILKGRQTGTMHRGHTWVFRAESHDTMMAWYEDIKALTESKTAQERSEFVRGHARSVSQMSVRSNASSDGVDDDDDEEPFAGESALAPSRKTAQQQPRPQPGGRFPSDLQVNERRGLPSRGAADSSVSDNSETQPTTQPTTQQLQSQPSSHLPTNHLTSQSSEQQRDVGQDDEPYADRDVIAAAEALPGSDLPALTSSYDHDANPFGLAPSPAAREASPYDASGAGYFGYGGTARTPLGEAPSHAAVVGRAAREDGVNPYTDQPIRRATLGAAEARDEGLAYLGVPVRQGGIGALSTEGSSDGGISGATFGAAHDIIKQGGQQPVELAAGGDDAHVAVAAAREAFAESAAGIEEPRGLDTEDEESYGDGEREREGERKMVTQRPGGGVTRVDSVPLHIPGEYPKATPV